MLAVASRRRQLTYALSVGLLLCAPAIGFYAGLVYFGYTLNQFTPAVPNDQVVYFLSAQAFHKAGFNAGYFTMDEEPARASFSHFDPHGPMFPMLYGTLARCVGLSYTSGPIFNVVLLSAALAAWCLLVRPGQALVLWTAVLFLTYWPYYACVYSWMQETTHLAIAVVLAGIFTALLNRRPYSGSVSFRTAAVVFVCAAAMLRISWALMLPPLCILFLRRLTWKSIVVVSTASAAGILALMSAFHWICAPYSNVPTAFMMNKLVTLNVDPAVVLQLVWSNLERLGVWDSPLENLVIDQNSTILIVASAAAVIALMLRRGRWQWLRPAGASFAERPGAALFCCYNQAVITLATVTTYSVGNGGALRVFSVHSLLGILVAGAARQRALRLLFFAVIAFNVMMRRPCLDTVNNMTRDSFSSGFRVTAFREMIRDALVFDPKATPWDNTVLVDRYPPDFAGMTPGIGVSLITRRESFSRPKSRYIIASPVTIARAKTNVRLLRKLPGVSGELFSFTDADPNLYLNLSPSR
jgi:hypothetical protein